MATIFVKVVPGASRDRVAGRYGDGIKIQTSAAPEKGKANEAAARLLANWLGVAPSAVQLISAPSNPRKTFRIATLTPAALAAKLASL